MHRFVALLALCVGLCAAAQTTTFYAVPTSCLNQFSVNYNESCTLQAISPDGTDPILFHPVFSGRYSYIFFGTGSGTLSGLGYGAVTLHTTTLLTHTDNGLRRGNTLLQGYTATDTYSEHTEFVNQDPNAPKPFSGAVDSRFTTTTRCCGSGRDPGPHTTAAYTYFSGSLTE